MSSAGLFLVVGLMAFSALTTSPARLIRVLVVTVLVAVLFISVHAYRQAGYSEHSTVADLATHSQCGWLDKVSRVLGFSCGGIVYVWSDLMPLSIEGINEIRAVAIKAEVPLYLVNARDLDRISGVNFTFEKPVDVRDRVTDREAAIAGKLIETGATVHYPSAVRVVDGEFRFPAQAGYREAEVYQQWFERAIRSKDDPDAINAANFSSESGLTGLSLISAAAFETGLQAEYSLPSSVGAYFKSLPGQSAIAFE